MMFDFTKIEGLRLSQGKHETPEDGVCFYEAVAFFAGEPHSDRPKCASPVLIGYGISLNDDMPDDLRNELLVPLIGQVAGTIDPKNEVKRGQFLAMWSVNKILPIPLRACGLEENAKRCEAAKTRAAARDAAEAAAYAAYAAADATRDAAAASAAYAASAASSYARAADDAARAADDAQKQVWSVAVEGLQQAILIGKHEGFINDPSDRLPAFKQLVGDWET